MLTLQYVLSSAWLVLNSSIAEGLPLALGGGRISGAPIVCTEAGGSREVFMGDHPDHVYGRSVSPGNPYELAVAQIAVLGLFDGLEAVAYHGTGGVKGDEPKIYERVNLETWISERRFDDIWARILSKREGRRQLGLRLREHVLKQFHGKRYLREQA